MGTIGKTLRQRLMAKGMEDAAIPAYTRNVANILTTESLISLMELNRRLELLGWGDYELDDYTLELIKAVLDLNDVFVPGHWGDIIPDSEKLDNMDTMEDSLLELERGLFPGVYE